MRNTGIYIKRLLVTPAEIECFASSLDLEKAEDPPHVTLIYSKRAVDWRNSAFLEQQDFLTISPVGAQLDRFGEHLVVKLKSSKLRERFDCLVKAGAVSDHMEFQPHITIGRDPQEQVCLQTPVDLRKPLIFGSEMRKVPKECRTASQHVPDLRSSYTRGHRNKPSSGAITHE